MMKTKVIAVFRYSITLMKVDYGSYKGLSRIKISVDMRMLKMMALENQFDCSVLLRHFLSWLFSVKKYTEVPRIIYDSSYCEKDLLSTLSCSLMLPIEFLLACLSFSKRAADAYRFFICLIFCIWIKANTVVLRLFFPVNLFYYFLSFCFYFLSWFGSGS